MNWLPMFNCGVLLCDAALYAYAGAPWFLVTGLLAGAAFCGYWHWRWRAY